MSTTHTVRTDVGASRFASTSKSAHPSTAKPSSASTRPASWAYALLVVALTSVTSAVAHASAAGDVSWGPSHAAGLIAASCVVLALAKRIHGDVRSLAVVLVIGQVLDHLSMSLTGVCTPGHGGHHGAVQLVSGTSSGSIGLMFGAHIVATVVALVGALVVASMTTAAHRRLRALLLWLAGSLYPAPAPRPAFAARLFASREYDGGRRHPHRGPPNLAL